LTDKDKVLEIGTGSGYQAAILAEIVQEVYSVEIVQELALRAQEVLTGEGYTNIYFHSGDGTFGWHKHAPYDAIIVTAAPTRIPEKLQDQLEINGRMILPVGDAFQELVLINRGKSKFKTKKLLPVRFVPLISPH
jgi:protein-L-isoaspartate(D-aspartate) O-methyltransferase